MVKKMNDLFQQAGIDDRFVAFLLCILDPATGQVTVVNAGQVPPLLRKADGKFPADSRSATDHDRNTSC